MCNRCVLKLAALAKRPFKAARYSRVYFCCYCKLEVWVPHGHLLKAKDEMRGMCQLCFESADKAFRLRLENEDKRKKENDELAAIMVADEQEEQMQANGFVLSEQAPHP